MKRDGQKNWINTESERKNDLHFIRFKASTYESMSRHKLAHNTLLCLLGWYENLSFPGTGSSSSTMLEIFLSRINPFSLFRETSQVYVNNMHKINSLYTILLLFFDFFSFFIRKFGR